MENTEGCGPVKADRSLKAVLVAALTATAVVFGMVIGDHVVDADTYAPAALPALKAGQQAAIFAGGCFWCMEPAFDKVDGVLSTTSGYIGGDKDNPTYKEVSNGETGHAEALRVVFDPKKVTYKELLDVFWHNIDPLAENHQFCDHGTQYRSGVFYLDEEQHKLASASKVELEESKRFDKPILTEVTPAKTFYPAEEYHQDYYKKNPSHYKAYRYSCGRDRRLKELWGSAPVH